MRALGCLLGHLCVMLLIGTSAIAQSHSVETCTGRIATFTGNGELISKGTEMLQVLGSNVENSGEDCTFFVTERNSANGRKILRTCPIGSRCRIKAYLEGGDGGIESIIDITRIR